jgi:hypothetical protein
MCRDEMEDCTVYRDQDEIEAFSWEVCDMASTQNEAGTNS